METQKQRLAKVLAGRGVASRRKAEELIAKGQVEVNGMVVDDPAFGVDDSKDRIAVEGRILPPPPKKVYFLLNKPKGYIVSRDDPGGRKLVMELLPDLPARVEAVGRLDINTEGALLLTNDGSLAHAMTHPGSKIPKRYLAKIWKEPSEGKMLMLQHGVNLEDGKTAPAKVRIVESTDSGNTWVEITVTEGRNHLVRRMFAAIGHPVSKLKRVSFATLSVRDLPVGQYRALDAEEVARLKDLAAGVSPGDAKSHSQLRKSGFAKPDPKWMQKRVFKSGRR
jgi:pseudouridine synthase